MNEHLTLVMRAHEQVKRLTRVQERPVQEAFQDNPSAPDPPKTGRVVHGMDLAGALPFVKGRPRDDCSSGAKGGDLSSGVGSDQRHTEASMDDYVAKPVTPQALAEVLERWLPVPT